MKKITQIKENPGIFEYLEKRQLTEQYRKAKGYVIEGHLTIADFKVRMPKISKIYQFRINKQFRAFGFFDENHSTVFRVIEISNHQD